MCFILFNKGVKSESRGSFIDDEYKRIYMVFWIWYEEINDKYVVVICEVLRNYVFFLVNIGIC